MGLNHERLIVYDRTKKFIEVVADIPCQCAELVSAVKHLDRASDSIAYNIAQGSGSHYPANQAKYYDTAIGSALECAAALDLLQAFCLIDLKKHDMAKAILFKVVLMLWSLRYPKNNKHPAHNASSGERPNSPYVLNTFRHEKLDAYKLAIEHAGWVYNLLREFKAAFTFHRKTQLDESATAIALNLAEGNAKPSARGRKKFFDIALVMTMKNAVGLDIASIKSRIDSSRLQSGKWNLDRLEAMLNGLINGK